MIRVHLALIFVQITWGSWHVVGKYVLKHLQPMVLADIRVLGAVPLFMTASIVAGHKRPANRDLLLIAVLGLLGVFANQILFIEGLQRTTATNGGILMAAMPVFTTATAAVLRIERVRGVRLAGVLLAVAGAAVMLDLGRFDLAEEKLAGNSLILANCFCYSLFVVLQRTIVHRIPPLAVTAWAFLIGGTGVAIIATPSLLAADFSAVPASVWWSVVYIVLIPTTLNYALIAWALRWSSPALVATYTTMQPIAAAVLAAIFLGEHVGWREAVGFVLIAAGLFAVSRARP